MTDLVGQSLGRYRILGLLGAGGMGSVYRARDTEINREVAVKVIRGGEFAGEKAVRRFQDETEAVAAYLVAADPVELASSRPAPPAKLIQPEEIAELVLMFVRDGTLAGRVVVWPDGEPWQLVPDDLMFRY